jgi:hypothetical protein
MCVLFTQKVIIVSKTSHLENTLGNKLAYLNYFEGIEFGKYSIAIPHYYSLEGIRISKDSIKSKLEILQDSYLELVKIPYNASQSNPYEISQEGGNCQALSLVLGKTLETNGIEFKYYLDQGLEHMSVVATIGAQEILVDIVNKTLTLK